MRIWLIVAIIWAFSGIWHLVSYVLRNKHNPPKDWAKILEETSGTAIGHKAGQDSFFAYDVNTGIGANAGQSKAKK